MLRNNGIHNFRSPLIAQGPVPSLTLDFAGTGTLDSSVTFTRSTTATYINSSGFITNAAINVPRFNYNPSTLASLGLLIEEQRTNLFTYSNTFSNPIWVLGNVSYSTTSTLCPDGTSIAQTWTANGASGTHFFSQVYIPSANATTCSIYAKAGTNNFFQIRLGADASVYANFNVATGVIGNTGNCTATITPSISGWYHCSITYTSATATSVAFCIVTSNTAVRNESNSLSTSVLFYGGNLEVGAFATSFIPTTASQVTRTADNASMTGTNFTSWFNQTEGTFYISFDTFNKSGPPLLSGQGVSAGIFYSSIVYDLKTFNGSTGASTSNYFALNTTAKGALSYNSSGRSIILNGGTVVTVAGLFQTITQLSIGQAFGGYENGHIQKLSFYPTALTSAQIQALTT